MSDLIPQTNQSEYSLEAAVGKLKNHVPELLVQKGLDTKTFVAKCMLAGLSADTAYRFTRGNTNFNAKAMRIVADVLGLTSLSQVIDIVDEQ